MKKELKVILLLLIFPLDFLALDDITTGQGENFFWEYGMLAASAIVLGLMAARPAKIWLLGAKK